jgi:hypothetical protein
VRKRAERVKEQAGFEEWKWEEERTFRAVHTSAAATEVEKREGWRGWMARDERGSRCPCRLVDEDGLGVPRAMASEHGGEKERKCAVRIVLPPFVL